MKFNKSSSGEKENKSFFFGFSDNFVTAKLQQPLELDVQVQVVCSSHSSCVLYGYGVMPRSELRKKLLRCRIIYKAPIH